MTVYLFHVGLASFQLGKLKVGVKSLTVNVLIKNYRPEYEVLLLISTLVFVNLRSVANSRSPRRISRIAVALSDFASQIKQKLTLTLDNQVAANLIPRYRADR